MSDHQVDLRSLSAEQKRELLSQLLEDRSQREATYPLSAIQQGLWFLHQLNPTSSDYNLKFVVWLRGPCNARNVARTIESVMRRHDAMRTTFESGAGGPVQRVRENLEPDFRVVDAALLSDAELQRQLDAAADRSFDLEREPPFRVVLFRRTPDRHVLLMAAHHAVVDYWSFRVVAQEMVAMYRAEVEQSSSSLPAVDHDYAEYVAWQREMLAGPEGERLRGYWERKLTGRPQSLNLPRRRRRLAATRRRSENLEFSVHPDVAKQLRQLSRTTGASAFTIYTAAYQALLHRYCDQDDLIVGTPMLGRSRAQFQLTVGLCMNMVPLRADLGGNPTFRQLLEQVRRTTEEAVEHQEYPLTRMVRPAAGGLDLDRPALIETQIMWDREYQMDLLNHASDNGSTQPSGMFAIENLLFEQRGAAFELTLFVVKGTDNALRHRLLYDPEIFDRRTIERMADALARLLHAVTAAPDLAIDDVELIEPGELRRITAEFNDTLLPDLDESAIHEQFRRQAARTPEAIALVCGDRQLSYRELDRCVDRLAARLRRSGVGPDRPVGIHLRRSEHLVVAVLAVLRAGGAYLPLEPTYPAERLAFMIEDAGAALVVTETALAAGLPSGAALTLRIDEPDSSADLPADYTAEPPGDASRPDHLAYVIYTSGSTGRPKGVMVEHRNVANLFAGIDRLVDYDPPGTWGAVTSLSFDIHVVELLWTLTRGFRVVLQQDGESKADAATVAATLRAADVTHFQCTPTLARMLLSTDEGRAALSGVRTLLVGGETLSVELAGDLRSVVRGRILNMYGPTETTVWSAAHQVGDESETVPIGRPLANTRAYVLDRRGRPVPVGVAGELHLGGRGVARGYLNRPDLTADRFVADPFSDETGARLYRTGDLARFREDGVIEFLGRVDHQVKIRGHRVELGEIEARLAEHPSIRQCAIVAREVADEVRMAAYYSLAAPTHGVLKDSAKGPANGSANGHANGHTNGHTNGSANFHAGGHSNGRAAPTENELRAFLRETLPDYMLPGRFIALDTLPLTSGGKIDRAALPAPSAAPRERDRSGAQPTTPLERVLARIWAEVLELPQVGVDEDFFSLGGASTQVLEVGRRAKAAGIPISAEQVFRNPTIAELARHYEDRPFVGGNTLIDSLGVYLPERVVSTSEVMRGCRHDMQIELEKLTGIHSRRVAGQTEFSIDLAAKAIERCMAQSRFRADDVDLLICCNISRLDGADYRFTFEPSTAARLAARFKFRNALTFDVANACAGMFTGIYLADALLKQGLIDCALVVSGEYITHLTEAAQHEIDGDLDPRLACLTLGDAGAALCLSRAADRRTGFHDVDLYTIGRLYDLCVASFGEGFHRPMMLTDVEKMSVEGSKAVIRHWPAVAIRHGWTLDDVRHLIPHQVSDTSLKNGLFAVKGIDVMNGINIVNNVAERGNTATTTHSVALWDQARAGAIRSGDNVLFGVTASGMTIGAALYTFDDLPERLRSSSGGPRIAPERSSSDLRRFRAAKRPRMAIAAVAVARTPPSGSHGAFDSAASAAADCLAEAGASHRDLGLLMYTGVYRDDYLSEPAVAAIIAGGIDLNAEAGDDRKALAFDVLNGAVGPLQACYLALHAPKSERRAAALVVAAEVENNFGFPEPRLLGLALTASALLVRPSPDGREGFGGFEFLGDCDRDSALETYSATDFQRGHLQVTRSEDLEDRYVEAAVAVIGRLLEAEGLEIGAFRHIFPSQSSASFISKLAARLGVSRETMVDASVPEGDLFTSSLAYAWREARRSGRTKSGDLGLIVAVGSGSQAAAATYYF